MRVMQVKRVSPNELYTKRGLEREMNISVRSINKYVICLLYTSDAADE